MLNHLHFIAQAPDLIGVVRGMKRHLSKVLQENIIATEPRVLELFKISGRKYGIETDGSTCNLEPAHDLEPTSGNGYSVWQPGNYPELIESEKFLEQKVHYIHMNPVRKQYVYRPEDWKWSSASAVPTRIQISPVH